MNSDVEFKDTFTFLHLRIASLKREDVCFDEFQDSRRGLRNGLFMPLNGPFKESGLSFDRLRNTKMAQISSNGQKWAILNGLKNYSK